jgi:uncharacterized protein (DUF2147 family)
MHKIICILAVVLLALPLPGQEDVPAEADRILGTWLTGSGKGRILITKYGDKYGGKLVWLREPNDETGKPKTDSKNPDAAKRGNPRLGLNNLLGFSYAGGGKYENGTIYDPENGKTYKCVMSLDGDDVLNVRGYIGFTLIGRTDVWTRVK